MAKRMAAAILMCAVMVMIAAAPLAMSAEPHHIVKGAQGPRASAVTWEYVPVEYGTWYGHIVNTGLKSLVVDVFDNTTGVLEDYMHQRIRFAAYDAFPSGTVDTEGAVMNPTHKYVITVTPNGPIDSYCDVEDVFVPARPPTAEITLVSQQSLTVTVDGSASSDDGMIMGYGWDFGDGTRATGVTATHTYAASGQYLITLVVLDNDGLQGSDELWVDVQKVLVPPVALFTATPNFLVVSVDASASTDADGTITSYAWSWGDATPDGSGKVTTHTYAADGTYTITLTVTDNDLLTNSLPESVTVAGPDDPPVAFFTASVDGLTVSVDASLSSDDHGIVSYVWSWGDGTADGSGKITSHTYVPPALAPEPGAHRVMAPIALAPGPPYLVEGYITDALGNPVECYVTITNLRTAEVGYTNSFQVDPWPLDGYYEFDLQNKLPSAFLSGDQIKVDAVSVSGTLAGSITVTVPTPTGGFLPADVTVTGTGPLPFDRTITLTVTDTKGQSDTYSVKVTLTQ